jgi:hypothetical protein
VTVERKQVNPRQIRTCVLDLFSFLLLHTQQTRQPHSTPWSTHQHQQQQYLTESTSTRRLAARRLLPASGDSSNIKRGLHSSLNSHTYAITRKSHASTSTVLSGKYLSACYFFSLRLFIASVCLYTRNLTSKFMERTEGNWQNSNTTPDANN